jgi:hypothetical protein
MTTNLQLITNKKNTSKDRKNKTSKYTGVSWHKQSNKWLAQFKENGTTKYLGTFESEEKAKLQFTQVPLMFKAFEYWMGPYPFYEDGYQLIQSSHLGMEHQSAVSYGNKFANGYLGRDLSGSGWGKNLPPFRKIS